jgi:hypothetical protein
MEIELKNGTKKHVERDLAEVLIASGLATEVIKFEPYHIGEMKWGVREGCIEGDYQRPPLVVSSCSGCAHRGQTESFKGTAHTHPIHHCLGQVSFCPKDVADKYLELFAKWKSRSRKMPVEQVSASTPAAHNIRMGLKSREELIRDAQIGAKAFPGGR